MAYVDVYTLDVQVSKVMGVISVCLRAMTRKYPYPFCERTHLCEFASLCLFFALFILCRQEDLPCGILLRGSLT